MAYEQVSNYDLTNEQLQEHNVINFFINKLINNYKMDEIEYIANETFFANIIKQTKDGGY